MDASLQKMFEEQMNKEWYSSYLYLALSARLDELGFKGMASWMHVQAQEEMAHAMHIYDHLIDRCDHIGFLPLEGPDPTLATPMDAFQAALEHEKYITDSINQLATAAMKLSDHASYIFLQWYVNEQVEEEATDNEIIAKLRIIGDNASGLYALDQELGARVFVDPFAGAAQA